MTVEDVQKRLQAIRDQEGDDEAAHSMEDDLYIDVLKAIAAGTLFAWELAQEVLKAKEIDFERWCA